MMKRELSVLLLGVAVVVSLAMAAPSLAGYGDVVLGDTPIAWYRLADISDSSTAGANHPLTVHGDAAFTGTSPVVDHPTAAALDGSGDYFTAANHADFNFGRETDFSIQKMMGFLGGDIFRQGIPSGDSIEPRCARTRSSCRRWRSP